MKVLIVYMSYHRMADSLYIPASPPFVHDIRNFQV